MDGCRGDGVGLGAAVIVGWKGLEYLLNGACAVVLGSEILRRLHKLFTGPRCSFFDLDCSLLSRERILKTRTRRPGDYLYNCYFSFSSKPGALSVFNRCPSPAITRTKSSKLFIVLLSCLPSSTFLQSGLQIYFKYTLSQNERIAFFQSALT